MPSRRFVGLPLLLFCAALALGWNLGRYRLLDPDEGRNAEVAREMAASHDYLVPRLDGLPYLDKPIMYFAAAAGLMELFGPNEITARLPAYVATLATVVLLVAFARRRWGVEAGWLAGLAYASMVLPLVYAGTAIFDSTLTLWTTAAILGLYAGQPVAAWGAMAAGVLTKGPIAMVIPLLAVGAYLLVTGQSLRRLASWRALAVFAILALPWCVAVALKYPDFPRYVFLRETVERVTTGSFRRTAPLWYYLPIVAVAAFPWIVPALARVREWRAAWQARRGPASAEPILLACWVLVPLAFLTLDQSKLPQYVLPLMPAFALAATRNLTTHGIATGARAYALIVLTLAAALLALTRWLPVPLELTPAEKAAIPPTAFALGLVAVASAALVGLGAFRRGPRTAVVGYALVVIAIPFVSSRLLIAVGEDRSSASVASATAAALERSGGSGTVLGIFAYPPSLPFYLGRPVAVATATGVELTSNYIADAQRRLRGLAGSPLLPADSWRDALVRCQAPTVFLTTAANQSARATLSAALPLLVADGHYAAYGPCVPPRGASGH